ncbi:MAG TPA: phosphoglycerate kinase [Vicinamibacterales bacterium]|nr:phosphoglycerate kinase [Vicinamibacterales bacterium]
MTPKRSITDLALDGKRVLMRVDFNVPIKNGAMTDDTRIRASLPTIRYALDHGATVILCSHLGRPKGQRNPEYSLRPVAVRLAELLGRPVEFADDCIGPSASAAIDRAGANGVVLLENLRFHPEEEKNDPAFAQQLASLADVYVDDAFGSAHRAHASTEGVVRFVKDAAAGLLMAAELEHLGRVLHNPDRPLVAVLGGAKVSDKLEVIENLIPRVDALLVGGAMAYTFFKAQGLPVGRSLVEDDLLDAARDIVQRAQSRGLRFELPSDHVVAEKIAADVPFELLAVGDPAIGQRMGLDIGPKTIETYRRVIGGAQTVVWNGPMGVFEIDVFAAGTMAVAKAVADVKGTTVIGGGDSIAAVAKAGVSDRITHISTGGGASLEFLAGRELPGVAALPDR